MLYKPCSHCPGLAPLFDKLGSTVTNRDRTVALPWASKANLDEPGSIKVFNTIGADRERCLKPGETEATPGQTVTQPVLHRDKVKLGLSGVNRW